MILKRVFSPCRFNSKFILLTIGVVIVYITSGLIGQVFAIPPGNITPVWLPSGLMFALCLRFGTQVWPGIFLGAFFGNIWAYFSLTNLTTTLFSVFAASLNGLGDVLAIVMMVEVIKSLIKQESPLSSLPHFMLFLFFGVLIGPAISAIFGVTGLAILGFLPWEQYLFSLVNWWIGDGVGVLLLAPLLYSFLTSRKNESPYYILGSFISMLVFTLFAGDIFELIHLNTINSKVLFLATPVAFVMMLISGHRAVYSVQFLVVSIAVYATYSGKGPFVEGQYSTPLIELQLFIAIFSIIVFSLALLVEEKRLMLIKLNEKQQELEDLYRHDQLTNLWNRYRIEEFLTIELNRYVRSEVPFSLFIIDIDNFKEVNDNYGHLEGDRILKELSKLLEENTRSSDLVGRWGGEEFVIIAMEPDFDKATVFAKKIVSLVGTHQFNLNEPIQVSVGYTQSKNADTNEKIIKRADQALYEAKNSGKNRAVAN